MFDLKKSFKSDLIRRTFYKYGKLSTPITTHILKNAMKITEKNTFQRKKKPFKSKKYIECHQQIDTIE